MEMSRSGRQWPLSVYGTFTRRRCILLCCCRHLFLSGTVGLSRICRRVRRLGLRRMYICIQYIIVIYNNNTICPKCINNTGCSGYKKIYAIRSTYSSHVKWLVKDFLVWQNYRQMLLKGRETSAVKLVIVEKSVLRNFSILLLVRIYEQRARHLVAIWPFDTSSINMLMLSSNTRRQMLLSTIVSAHNSATTDEIFRQQISLADNFDYKILLLT